MELDKKRKCLYSSNDYYCDENCGECPIPLEFEQNKAYNQEHKRNEK